ncbi:MAG: CAP domain-containing protein [Candidatus Shapirobacteria bacterium]|nr:CAP domain-containing protein [Candidatus Shapirobacteria bacterium]MDD4410136.1 CAP domain-containing protein [Candidatus Shapirobacteria bacterium]
MKTKNYISWIILILEITVIVILIRNLDKIRGLISPKVDVITEEIKILPTITPLPTVIPTLTKKIYKPTPTPDNEPWGVSKQIDEVTWTMKIGEDEKMATAKEIYGALNEYRKVQGSQVLNWNEKLGNYAQERARFLNGIKSVDKHQGFNNFMENEDGFNKLGFTALGENISYGYRLNGVHTIEWMYAGDKPHNDNQLDNRWNYVGIGVDGLATCLIFGTGKF